MATTVILSFLTDCMSRRLSYLPQPEWGGQLYRFIYRLPVARHAPKPRLLAKADLSLFAIPSLDFINDAQGRIFAVGLWKKDQVAFFRVLNQLIKPVNELIFLIFTKIFGPKPIQNSHELFFGIFTYGRFNSERLHISLTPERIPHAPSSTIVRN